MTVREYCEPETIGEAIELLQRYDGEAKIIAGGQSLLMLMRHNLVIPRALVSLARIRALQTIRVENGGLAIGAMVTQARLATSSVVGERCPILPQASRVVASPPIRNLGTIGGNLCHGEPGADPPGALIAAGAQVRLVGPAGERTLPLEELFVDYLQTSVAPDEVLTEVLVPGAPARTAGVYVKCTRRAVDLAVVGVGVVLALDEGNRCREVRLGINGASVTPFRARAAEDLLRGQALAEPLLDEAGQAAAAMCEPFDDPLASAEYRRKMVRVHVKRALRRAIALVEGRGA